MHLPEQMNLQFLPTYLLLDETDIVFNDLKYEMQKK